MVDNISLFDSGQSAASISTATQKSQEAKAASFEQALNAASENQEAEEIMEAAREFESYFLQMMLKEMRNSVPKDGLIPKNNAEEIFQGMLDEEYSKNAAKGPGIGIAQMIFEQMTRNSQYSGAPLPAAVPIQQAGGAGGDASGIDADNSQPLAGVNSDFTAKANHD